MNDTRLRGSIVPLVTPFRGGEVDFEALRALLEWQIASGSHGISVTGSTGEPAALTIAERERVIATTVEIVRGRVPVVAGTGAYSLAETLHLTRFAEEVGVDALLVITPPYSRPTQEGLYRYFVTVAQATRLPIIIYNIPGRTAVNLEPETLARIREACPNVVGVKEANLDFTQVSRLFDRCGFDFLVYSGIEALCFPLLALGGAGYFSATANVLPRELAQLYELTVSGRWIEARALHFRLLEMNEALFIESNPGPVKFLLGLMGKIEPELRLPLVLPSPQNQQRLRAVARRYGLIEGAD
ncbi:MAG: 4-hydroxy-tetrahydrodipicolinate synthase [Dehalococcoidia bacterium]|nr:4-hydroxy-tetrahydrodipicolinate synthase [Dehalococcoidia bacterium]